MQSSQFFSLGDAARRLGVPRHVLAYAFENGLLAEPPRLGGRRMIPVADLQIMAQKLEAAKRRREVSA